MFLVIRRFSVLLFVISALMTTHGAAQDATVTVYAHGSNWTSGLPGTDHGIYYGCIYDGAVRLNCFKESKLFAQVRNNRFVVFHLPPGPHVFSASYGRKPSKRSQLAIDLIGGQNYYLRAQSESRGVLEVEWEYGRLDQMTCEVAQTESQKAKPMKGDVFSPAGIAALAAVQAIPGCQ
jgi:hypothetical protein